MNCMDYTRDYKLKILANFLQYLEGSSKDEFFGMVLEYTCIQF